MQCEQHPLKPAWRILRARKQTREAMAPNTSTRLEHEDVQTEVLDRRLAWKVWAHRRSQRQAIARCDADSAKDL
eukprot:2543250-Rhodomonas_salina.2